MDWLKIERGMPRDELIAIHRRIWDYAIEHGGKPETPYIYGCVGCEVSWILYESSNDGIMCSHCPIKWPDGITCAMDMSLYDAWCHEKYPLHKRLLAEQIRNLEFKDDIWEDGR